MTSIGIVFPAKVMTESEKKSLALQVIRKLFLMLPMITKLVVNLYISKQIKLLARLTVHLMIKDRMKKHSLIFLSPKAGLNNL